MKICPRFLALLGALALAGRLEASIATVPAAYGEAANFMAGILQYPDFTVRYANRTEHARTDSRVPWVTQTFEVLDRDHRTIGGDITFNADHRANGRRFDVHKKIYVAEFYRSTADNRAASPALGPDQIVIWDEASAREHSLRLAPIWDRESIDPESRYSSQHTYADGELLPEYAPEKEVTRIGPGVKPTSYNSNYLAGNIPLAERTHLAPWETAVPRAYGDRTSFRSDAVRTPDICVQLTQRTDHNPLDPDTAFTTWQFHASDRAGNESFPTFQSISTGNGSRVALGGQVYFIEMFATTAVGGNSRTRTLPLPEGQFVIWNEENARKSNPAILAAWEKEHERETGSRSYAAGVALGPGFMGTYGMGRPDCSVAELDQPLVVVSSSPLVYPPELSGSGFIGRVGGFLTINEDGTVEAALTGFGNDERFCALTRNALMQFRFAPPRKGGRPVKVSANFSWRIAEPAGDNRGLEFH